MCMQVVCLCVGVVPYSACVYRQRAPEGVCKRMCKQGTVRVSEGACICVCLSLVKTDFGEYI